MRKLFLLSASAGLLLLTAFKNVPSDFEGTIVYDIKFDESAIPAEQLAMMAGSSMKLAIKGDKTRTEMNMGFMNMTILSDKKTNTGIQLMDMMGQKMMLKTSLDSLNKKKDNLPAPKITYLKDTKEIAGYKCKNAEIVATDEQGNEYKTIAWFTDELPYEKDKGQIKGLNGFPLEYTMSNNGVKFTMTAKSVTKEKLPDSTFDVPDGYSEMTPEQMNMMMGGGR